MVARRQTGTPSGRLHRRWSIKPPAEFKVLRVRECLAPADLVDTPERAYQYWIANIVTAPWFDPAKEAFVILILNTRRRIIGHNLVALGSLDSVPVHPRDVFRPAIVTAGVLFPFSGVLMSPMLAGVAMSLSSVSVIGNALRLRKVRLG